MNRARLAFGLSVALGIALAVVFLLPERPPPSEGSLGPVDGQDLPGVDTGRVAVGDLAPDFTLLSRHEGPLTLSDFRGDKDVILVFYRGHW